MAKAMIDGLYRVYGAQRDHPELIVLTPLVALSARSSTETSEFSNSSSSKEDELRNFCASIETLATVHSASWAILVTTERIDETALPLTSRVCYVTCGSGSSGASSVHLPADCGTAWAALLRHTREAIESPQRLVALLACHEGMRLAPPDLARLYAECVWLDEHQSVSALLALLALPPRDVCAHSSQLRVECCSHVEMRRGGEAKFHADVRLLEAERSFVPLSFSHTVPLPPPKKLMILHPYGTHAGRRQINRLLKRLSPHDRVCVCVAGEVTVPTSSAASALRRMCAVRSGKWKISSSAVGDMRRLWEVAENIISQWHREDFFRHRCDTSMKRGDTGEEEYSGDESVHQTETNLEENNAGHFPRTAVLFFLPDDCITIQEASVLTIVRRSPAFFHVPIVCLTASMHIANAHVLLDLCKLTQGCVLFAQDVSMEEEEENSDSEIEKWSTFSLRSYNAMVDEAMQFITDLTHYDVSLTILSFREDLDERWGPLHVSDTFGMEKIVFGHDSRPLGRQQLLSPLTTKSGAWVYLRRAWKGKHDEEIPNLSTGGIERIVLSAYNINTRAYEMVYVEQNRKQRPLPSPSARDWWGSMLYVFQLFYEERPDVLEFTKSTISRTWFYFGMINDLEATEYYQLEVQPLLDALDSLRVRDKRRREFLIVMWILKQLHHLRQFSKITRGKDIKRHNRTTSRFSEMLSSSTQSEKRNKPRLLRGALTSQNKDSRYIDYRWTNFSDEKTSFSTLQAIITHTCPFTNDPVGRIHSTTFSIAKLSGHSALVNVKSVKHIPSLALAVEHVAMLFQVDIPTGRMEFDRRVSHEQLISNNSVIEFLDLLPSQLYCLVHLALQRPAESRVGIDDVLLADGIVFNTSSVRVNELHAVSVSHNTVELDWKGDNDGNDIKAVRLKLCPFRWMVHSLPVTSDDDDGGIVEVNHQTGTRCVVTGLQPCTVYHVTAVPIFPGQGDMNEWKTYGAITELYVSTCMIPKESDFSVEWTPHGKEKVHLLLSYPIHHGTVCISPSCTVKLSILPRISIGTSNNDENKASYMQEDNKHNASEDRVSISHSAKLSESHLVSIYFETILRAANRPLNGLQCDTRLRSEGFSTKIGPFSLADGIRIVNIAPTSAQLQWNADTIGSGGSLVPLVKPLYGTSGDPLTFSLMPLSHFGDSKKYIINGLAPCFRYEALLKRKGKIDSIARVEFITPPLPPPRSVVSAVLSTFARELSVKLSPRNPDDERFLVVTILPFTDRVDNLSMNNAFIASYEELPPGQPLVLSIVNSWVSHDGDLLRSAPICLYAVTNIECKLCPSGHLMLSWTCAAGEAQTREVGGTLADTAVVTPPSVLGMVKTLTDSVDGKDTHDTDPIVKDKDVFLEVVVNDTVCARNPQNVLCLELPNGRISLPISLRFRGPAIIEEASPIFVLPPPPALTTEFCQLKWCGNGLVQVRLLFSFMNSLRVTLNSIYPFVSAELVSNSGTEIRLPLEDIEHEELQFFIPVSSSAASTTISVRLNLDETNSLNTSYESFNKPVIFTPWPLLSEPFEIYRGSHRTKAVPTVDLRVMALFPTCVTLSWTPLEDDKMQGDAGVCMYVVVQSALEVFKTTRRVMTFYCTTPQFSINYLEPATPYIISVSRSNEGENPGLIRFVTPFNLTDDTLRELLGSLLVLEKNEENEKRMVSGRSYLRSSKIQYDYLKLVIPKDQKLLLKISPNSNWFMDSESDSISGCNPVQHTLRGSLSVALVSASGDIIQKWECLDELRGHGVSCFFPDEVYNHGGLLPHLSVKVFSRVWIERSRSFCTADFLMPNSEFNGENERVVDVIGCPSLSYIAENCFIVEWKGSCEVYHVRWRTGLSPVIHLESITRGDNQNPRLKIITTDTDVDVFLFSVYSAHRPSNCLSFCVLVPPKPRCIPLTYLSTGGCRAQLPSVNRSDLLEILWSINVSGSSREARFVRRSASATDSCETVEVDITAEELRSDFSFVVTARITNTSLVVWEETFADMLSQPLDDWTLPLPLQIAWLNPTVSVCFPIDL